MQLNQAKFFDNGGYVTKTGPNGRSWRRAEVIFCFKMWLYLEIELYPAEKLRSDPTRAVKLCRQHQAQDNCKSTELTTRTDAFEMKYDETLRLQPIVGRHIPKRNAIFQSVLSVEVIEFENSEKKQMRSNTGFGLCPDWYTSSNGQSIEFKVSDPTIAFLRFSLRDSQDQTFLLAQSTCPVTILRSGEPETVYSTGNAFRTHHRTEPDRTRSDKTGPKQIIFKKRSKVWSGPIWSGAVKSAEIRFGPTEPPDRFGSV